MSELEEAVAIAEQVLDQPWGDPDADIGVVSRQFLRALGREKSLSEEVSRLENKPATPFEKLAKEMAAELERLRKLVREHRDSWLAGDDKCWKDNEVLYAAALPEGFTPPARDSLCELANCVRYVTSCHHPQTTYVSPQRRIEELENEVARLLGSLNYGSA